MSVKLVLLGMLRSGPQYGYELKHRIEDEMGDWTSIAFGSIYFALKKLTEESCVKQTGEEQHGNRPSRIIYEITEKGNREFRNLLLKVWTEEDRQYFPFDIGLYFMKELPQKTCLEILRGRIEGISHALEHLKNHRAEELQHPYVPAHAEAIFSHSLHHLDAELKWLKETEKKLVIHEY